MEQFDHFTISYNDFWGSYKSISEELNELSDDLFINDSKQACIDNKSIWTISVVFDDNRYYIFGSSLSIIIEKIINKNCSQFVKDRLLEIPVEKLTKQLKNIPNSFYISCHKFDDYDFDEHEQDFLNINNGKLKCIEQYYWWNMQFYPRTPVGFWHGYSHDINELFEYYKNSIEIG